MESINTSLSEILAKYRKGMLSDAEAGCLKILNKTPFNADARHLLGLIYIRKGDTLQAFKQISKAIDISPDTAAYHCSLGNLHLENGDINNALSAFRKTININPYHADAHYLIGVTMQRTGQLESAAESYRHALKARPDYADANCNLGTVLHILGQFDDAVTYYRKALSADPGNYQIDYNLAGAFMAQQQYSLAEKHLRKVLDIKPDFTDACFNLGVTLSALGNHTEALVYYRKTVQLQPDHTEAQNNIGTILMTNGDYQGATDIFRNSLKFSPANPKLHFNLGATLKETGQYTEAIHCFSSALELDPDFAKAYAELHRCRQTICDWRGDEYTTDNLIELTENCLQNGVESPVYPFDSLSLPFTPEILRKIAASHANAISKNAGSNNRFTRKYRNRTGSRLRIGYVSQKFNNHAGAHLIASLFGLHDRNMFQIFAYSIGQNDRSIYRQRIEQGCENFIDVSGQNFIDVAQRIHDDGIDILIDLGVYNTNAMTEIFALRPAPVQVSYLGYPGTSGASFYDYILTDHTVTPPDQQQWFSEKFAYLPNCYQVNDHQLKIPEEIPDRSTCELPDNVFVFCSFNNSYKIEPVIFGVWMNILARVPESVLWLLDHTRETTANLSREADARGIDSERLVFAEKLPKDLHLARHRHADLFLDTRVYNAHTTASDSLRVGVPVLTTPGTTFASRVAASLLNAVNLPEMIATNLTEYTNIAVKYSTNDTYRGKIMEKLSTNLDSAALFNTPLYARHLECAFRYMWEICTSGSETRQITVNSAE